MIELTLPDMTCGHCVKTVTGTVMKLDAQAQVQCDLPSHTVRIETTQAPDAVRKALADEGRIEISVVTRAIGALGVDPDKANPLTV